MMKPYLYLLIIIFTIRVLSGCKKFVDVDVPEDRLTSDKVFSDPLKAQSAVSAIYGSMINESAFFSGGLTVFTSFSSDELYGFNAQPVNQEFVDNHIQATNLQNEKLWQDCYKYIYIVNSAIAGMEKSGIADSLKSQLLGECHFFRAFYYFYLLNLYGNVPLVLTPDYTVTERLAAASSEDIYTQMILDLKSSKQLLNSVNDNNSKIRVNKWSAAALLARVYLYRKDWENALRESSFVIDSKKFSLNEDLRSVFKAGSTEAILQLQPLNGYIPELIQFYYPSLFGLTSYSTDYLLNSFEQQDLRRNAWFDSTTYQSVNYKYPGKYKSITFKNEEYYMVLRLSEQYLIRAEARAYLNDLEGAAGDLYVVRKRAGLQQTGAGTQNIVLKDILQERRAELFAEWGHRWFDLKRTDNANAVLSIIKPSWKSTWQLYPIPQSQLQANTNLSQNDGY